MEDEQKSAEVTEVTQAEPTLDEMKTQIAEMTGKVEEAQREAKSHQKYGRDTKAELDRQRGLEGEITNIKSTLKVVTEMMAETLDKGSEEEYVEKPKGRRSEEYLKRLEESDTQAKGSQQSRESQRATELGYEAHGLLKSVGLEMDKSPEAMLAYIKWMEGNPEGMLEEVKRIVSEKTEANKVDTEAQSKKEKEEARRQKMEDAEMLNTDINIPAGGTLSDEQFVTDLGTGKLPVTKENTARFNKIMQGG